MRREGQTNFLAGARLFSLGGLRLAIYMEEFCHQLSTTTNTGKNMRRITKIWSGEPSAHKTGRVFPCWTDAEPLLLGLFSIQN